MGTVPHFMEGKMKKITMILMAIFTISSLSVAVNSLNPAAPNEEVTLKEIVPFPYVCIHHKGPFTEIEGVVNSIWPTMQSQNIFPQGPMIGVYYNDPNEVPASELEWEIGFPVMAQAEPQPPLEKKIWQHTLVAAVSHTGPYETIAESLPKVFAWMEANGYVASGPIMERYMTMPSPEVNPKDYKSEIWVPCKKK